MQIRPAEGAANSLTYFNQKVLTSPRWTEKIRNDYGAWVRLALLFEQKSEKP